MRADDLPLTPPARGIEVAQAQCGALVRQLEALTPEQWGMVTECAPWTVREVAAHVDGALGYVRNPLQYAALVVGWLRWYRGRSFLDGTNEAAIRARRDLTTGQLLEALRRDSARAVPPRWARPIPLTGVADLPRYATFGYLTDVVLPRDCYMHRHDIAEAAGQAPETDDSDAEVVAQVVRDLGRQWKGTALTLRLVGPSGGTWQLGPAGVAGGDRAVELDAVEFMKHLSGRRGDPDLFDAVPDELRAPLVNSRVTF